VPGLTRDLGNAIRSVISIEVTLGFGFGVAKPKFQIALIERTRPALHAL